MNPYQPPDEDRLARIEAKLDAAIRDSFTSGLTLAVFCLAVICLIEFLRRNGWEL